MIDHESQSARILLAIADRREEIDAERCHRAFAHLAMIARLRARLNDTLARHRLSDLQFAALVVLFEIEPEPIPMAVLAEHTSVSRSAMTEALDKLEAHHLASRTRDRCDRRVIQVRITAAGRAKADQAIDDYFEVITRVPHYRKRQEYGGLFSAFSS